MNNESLALIIEDDVDLSLIFQTALEGAGFSVTVVFKGEEGLAWLKEAVPKLVVLDLNLPGIQGDVVLEEIRADKRLENTHVVLATANHLLAQALSDQADLVLVKPISYTQMRDLTVRFL